MFFVVTIATIERSTLSRLFTSDIPKAAAHTPKLIFISKEELTSQIGFKGKDSMYVAHERSCGGYISGEIKIAITLCILAGGDPCELAIYLYINEL